MGARLPVAQKLVALADAIMTSAPDAAKRHGISEHTIWKAAEEYGGLRALRELYETQQVASLTQLAGAISREVNKRLPQLTEDTLRELGLAFIKAALTPSQGTPTGLNINLSQQQMQGQQQDDPNRVAGIIGVLAESGLLQTPGSNGTEADAVHPAPPDG